MGLIDDIKNDVKKSGTNKGKFLYFKAGAKTRVRFLDDMDDGHKFTFHDSFQAGINVPCQQLFDKECPYCDDDELRTRDMYAWSVWDYEAKEVKILMAAVNQCSPVPSLVALYDTYGTLKDRDYVIQKSGQQQSTTFSVIPMDKAKFRNEKAKPLSDSKMLDLLEKAFPCDSASDDDEDENTKKKGNKSQNKPSGKKGKKPVDNDDDDDEEDDDEEMDYNDMDVKELYKECKKRDIDCEPKKKKSYYIELLEDDDSKSDDGWDDDDDDEDDEEDDWDE